MVIGYFGLTTFLTAFAFGSYLVLTKLILGGIKRLIRVVVWSREGFN